MKEEVGAMTPWGRQQLISHDLPTSSPPRLDPVSNERPVLALGMITGPSNAAKRQLVRETMLEAQSFKNGRAVFR